MHSLSAYSRIQVQTAVSNQAAIRFNSPRSKEKGSVKNAISSKFNKEQFK
jgi:hypothetical protein